MCSHILLMLGCLQFAVALPGSTPSTQHLAKKSTKPTVNDEEDSATPYYSNSPQAQPKPLANTMRLMKNFSVGANNSGEKKPKSGLIGGFRKLLSKN